MAERRIPPKQPGSFAANAAILLTAAFFSLPAVASSSTPIPCPKSEQPNLKVSTDALAATTVSHDISYVTPSQNAVPKQSENINPASLLAPRAEAAIREAFGESEQSPTVAPVIELIKTVTPPMADGETQLDEFEEDATIETPSGMTTRLPGVSDDDLSRFKKQMFRRDI